MENELTIPWEMAEESEGPPNVARLKLALVLQGINAGEEGPEVELRLAGNIRVVAPNYAQSPHKLQGTNGSTEIVSPLGRFIAKRIPKLSLEGRNSRRGVALDSFAQVQSGDLVLAPTPACELITQKKACTFCGVKDKKTFIEADVLDVLDAIETAKRVGQLRRVFLSIGLLDGADRGITRLEKYVRAIKKNFDVLVAVDAVPPTDNAWIDRTYAMGVDCISYNMEVYDPARFYSVCPGLAGNVGRDRYLAAIEYAATVFPVGAVTSHLVVGAEDPLATAQGVDHLTRLGAVPVLNLLRPFRGVDIRGSGATFDVPIEEVVRLYARVADAIERHQLNTRWVPSMGSTLAPHEAALLLPGKPWKQATHWDSTMGRWWMTFVSDWRRRLRVKTSE
jgi:hypothetical protein